MKALTGLIAYSAYKFCTNEYFRFHYEINLKKNTFYLA